MSSIDLLKPIRSAASSSTRHYFLPILLALAAFLISFMCSWIPSLWSDEVATVRATSLPLPALFHFLGYKDAVHGAYYLLLHAWTGLFGTNELTLRAPSAVAVGLACAGIVIIGRQLDLERTGLIAAVIFAVLPRTTYMGAEARSYALTAALAVLLTIVLLQARKKCTAFFVLTYALVAAVAILLFIYLALVVVAHIVFLIATRSPGRTLLRIAIASLVSVVALFPFVMLTFGEKNQVSWLGSQPAVNAWTVLVEPWFDSSVATALVAWALLVGAAIRWRGVPASGHTVLLCLSAAWVVVPTILLLIADAVVGPLYTSRYLSFAEPGFALLNAKFVNGVETDYANRLNPKKHKPREQVKKELEAHDRLSAESELYSFKLHEGPDEHGAVKLSCPARGKSATVMCLLYTPKMQQTDKDRAVIEEAPTDPPKCCTNETVTMHPIKEWKYLQALQYQSPEWRRTYSVDRNIVEHANAHVKDEGHEALDSPGRRRLRGLSAQQFLVSFLVAGANMRKIYKWREQQELPVEKRPRKKPRTREHLSLHNFDPRNAEVRERNGLPPLENSRRRDANGKKRREAML